MSISTQAKNTLTCLKKSIRNRDIEYITSTQNISTNHWLGTSEDLSFLTPGTTIYYKLPYNSNTSPVTINLTLNDGTVTGELPVYFKGTTRLTNQYQAEDIVGLVFDGNVWRVIDPYTNTEDITDIDITGLSIDFDMLFSGVSGRNDDITFKLDLIKGE